MFVVMRAVGVFGVLGCFVLSVGCGDDGQATSEDGAGTTSTTASVGTAYSASTTGPETTGANEPPLLEHTLVDIPLGLSSSCEHDGAERVLSERNSAVVPERLYTAQCIDGDGIPHMFVSLSVTEGHTRSHPVEVESDHAQLVFEAVVDPATGEFSTSDNAVHLTECLDGYGITAASDCSTVAALCRRPHFTSQTEPHTADLVAAYSGAETLTQPGPIGGEPTEAHVDYNDELWLYEWNDKALTDEPDRYVVHKGIGPLTRARGLGNYYLLNGENDESYAYAVRASTGGNTRHVSDSFLVVDRSGPEYAIAPGRGYDWACGRGHTLFNRPAYNPATQQYAIWCVTDSNAEQIPGQKGFWFQTESSERNEFMTVDGNTDHRQGSVQVLRPLADGNYLGALIGHPESVEQWAVGAATQVGLATFSGDDGSLLGDVRWVVVNSDVYLGHAQLSVIDEDRFLLGYAELYALGSNPDVGRNDVEFQIPSAYHVVEIDAQGSALSEPVQLDGVGWGDQDQWSQFANGDVAWAYVPQPTLDDEGGAPPCSYDSLQLSYYRPAR